MREPIQKCYTDSEFYHLPTSMVRQLVRRPAVQVKLEDAPAGVHSGMEAGSVNHLC
jgi:hypothetical protein